MSYNFSVNFKSILLKSGLKTGFATPLTSCRTKQDRFEILTVFKYA